MCLLPARARRGYEIPWSCSQVLRHHVRDPISSPCSSSHECSYPELSLQPATSTLPVVPEPTEPRNSALYHWVTLPGSNLPTPLFWGHRYHTMGIMNVTFQIWPFRSLISLCNCCDFFLSTRYFVVSFTLSSTLLLPNFDNHKDCHSQHYWILYEPTSNSPGEI